MKSNRENFIKDKKVLLDSQGSYEAKLWVACYLEQRQKNHSLKKRISEESSIGDDYKACFHNFITLVPS